MGWAFVSNSAVSGDLCARTAARSSAAESSSAPRTAITPSTSRRISCSKTSPRAGRDLFSRRVAALRVLHAKPFRVTAWAISNRMKQDLALRALNMAIAIRRPPPSCIHHTDRGSQYCAHDYQKLLRKHGFKISPLADERQGQLLRQFRRRKLLQVAEGRTRLAA